MFSWKLRHYMLNIKILMLHDKIVTISKVVYMLILSDSVDCTPIKII